MINAKRSIEACAAFYGDDSKDMKNYLLEGEKAALAMNNRGPISFDAQGNLAASIRNAYSENGFYIFEGVLNKDELDDIKVDLDKMRSNFPIHPESSVDINGEPALGVDSKALTLVWSKPLGDPLGGTDLANGRHQIKMFEPKAAEDSPVASPFILLGSLQFSEACLRTYAHQSY